MIITAGETKVLRFQRLDGDRQVIDTVPDEMYCTVKRNYDDEDFIFQKTIGEGIEQDGSWWQITIDPDDTKYLSPGKYVFDVKVIDDVVRYVVKPQPFTIRPGNIEGRPQPLSWNMSDFYKNNVLDVLSYIKRYKKYHPGSYAICHFNDIHGDVPEYNPSFFTRNEPNFVDFNSDCIDKMVFNGDIATVARITEYTAAHAYMMGASCDRLFVMGNHEYGWYQDGVHTGADFQVEDPEVYFKDIINVDVTYINTTNVEGHTPLIYYHDDLKNNVRYIVLNYYWVTRKVDGDGHLFDSTQEAWLRSVLASAGSLDVIILAHCTCLPFYYVPSDIEATTPSTPEYAFELTDQANLVDAINDYIDDTSHTGKFIMYSSGHYHTLGYKDYGFNMFTCPSTTRAGGVDPKNAFTFYIIDSGRIIQIQCPVATKWEKNEYSY